MALDDEKTFQGFHLCVALLFLALCRETSRVALSSRFRQFLKLRLPDWTVNLVLFLTQWWVLLACILLLELTLTKGNILAVTDATLDVRMDMQWLATLSRWACPACLVTYSLSLVSIGFQVRAAWCDIATGRSSWHRDLKWVLPYPRDVALQVLFMPMVYHLMMCRSLLRRWAVFDPYDPEASHVNLMAADGDAALAEMYDAYALWCFGNLGMLVADRELRHEAGLSLGESPVFAVLRDTLMFGVKAYVVTTVLGALYSIGVAFVAFTYDPSFCKLPDSVEGQGNATETEAKSAAGVCTFTQIIYGADFATSTIAIFNLFYFEHQLSGPLQKFNPGWKFWSMKIPVTLSFSELLLLKLTQPLTGLHTHELELLDTMTKAYFMMLVSLLNVFAWQPSEEWYSWEEVYQEDMTFGACEICCRSCRSEATSSEEETSESDGPDAEDSKGGCDAMEFASGPIGASSFRFPSLPNSTSLPLPTSTPLPSTLPLRSSNKYTAEGGPGEDPLVSL